MTSYDKQTGYRLGIENMKTYTRGYLMTCASLLLLLMALVVPSSGAGDIVWPVFATSTLLTLCIAFIAQFGKGKAKDWVEGHF